MPFRKPVEGTISFRYPDQVMRALRAFLHRINDVYLKD